jgi:23S rRNA (adenine2503-C2)-methyltransferase
MHRTDTPPHLLGMTRKELQSLVESLGQSGFRGRQIADWLYKRNVASIDEMTDLPAAFRAQVAQGAVLYRDTILDQIKSPDGTTKFLLELEDQQRIESVLLPYEERVSVCVSTQVGCAMACEFCATGIGGFIRDLTAGEIVDEVLTLQRESARRISHVVYMGMGEPLLNYDNVVKSLHLLNDEVGIGMRHITVSTVGITSRIQKLAHDKLQITLAVSLHAPNDEVRTRIMPIAARYPLKGLIEACREYAEETRRRITFEYLLIRDVNDAPAQARELVVLLKGLLCNVNLIPYNAVEGVALQRPTKGRVQGFRAILESAGIAVTQRLERGHSIAAACGQLRRRSDS